MVVVPGGWLVAPVAPVVGVGLAVLDVARFEAAFRVLALGWPPHDRHVRRHRAVHQCAAQRVQVVGLGRERRQRLGQRCGGAGYARRSERVRLRSERLWLRFRRVASPNSHGVQCTASDLVVVKVLDDKDVVLIKGAVPGAANGLVLVKGSMKDVRKYIVPQLVKEAESKNPMKASKKGAPAAGGAKK